MSSGASAWPGGSPVAGWAWPSRSRLPLKDRAASIPRASPQFLFDSDQPVGLGRPVGPGQRPRLDLAGVQAHGQVRDRDVLSLSGPVGHDSRVARPLRHLDRLQGFRQRADLVQLDEDRVPNALRNPLREDLRVGHEDVVANELHPMPQPLGEHLPALPVLLAQSVLDRDDRIAPDETLVIPDHILAGPPGLRLALHHVPAVLVELAGRGSSASARSLPDVYPAVSMACTMSARASSFEPRLGAKPPSSPTAVLRPFFFSRPFKVWKTSAAIRTASAKVVAPTGTIMNSWRSRLLSACAPPLITFINGTGRSQACGPPTERYKGSPASSAAAFATANDTPRIAFAPSLRLFGVPPRAIIPRSMAARFAASMPGSLGASTCCTLVTALRTPLPR